MKLVFYDGGGGGTGAIKWTLKRVVRSHLLLQKYVTCFRHEDAPQGIHYTFQCKSRGKHQIKSEKKRRFYESSLLTNIRKNSTHFESPPTKMYAKYILLALGLPFRYDDLRYMDFEDRMRRLRTQGVINPGIRLWYSSVELRPHTSACVSVESGWSKHPTPLG